MKKIAIVLLLVAFTAEARIGGGDSYSGDSSSSSSDSSSSYSSSDDDYDSGSSSSSGGSGGGSDVSGGFVFLLFFLFVFIGAVSKARESVQSVTVAPSAPRAVAGPASMAALRQYDPNFSEIVFTDFCYSLFARFHEARGRGQLDRLAPYFESRVRLSQHQGMPVDGVVIGSFTVTAFSGIESSTVQAIVEFEANYTEDGHRWYVKEEWTLTRARDVLSPHPEKSKAEHCPKCGAALETPTDGACLHCGAVIKDGSFHWFVTNIDVLEREARPPQLAGGGGGPEPGLNRPTVMQPWIGRQMKNFVDRHPGFTWEAFEARVAAVARELQNAWTGRDWSRARPLETDALFQTHRYWIDEYLRQGLRNVVDDYALGKIEIAKVTSDAFYDAITVRLYASGRDHTVDDAGNIVAGSKLTREWSEYWTFIRSRAPAPADTRVCPNCGGALAEGQTAICSYCGGKIITGEFPWVLSRIEQDESYRG